jgi:acrylyl-CoA reductase (NADPH)
MFDGLIVRQFGSPAELTQLRIEDLPSADVTVRVLYSSLNYKDGLAVASAGKVLRSFPCVPGIDRAGTVVHSDSPHWKDGDSVIVTGCGLGETTWGGYSQYARMPGDWIVRCPARLDPRSAMAIGTAGFTAMVAVLALTDRGVTSASGDIVVTGACGGVGSLAVALLAARGFRVVACTGRLAETKYLQSLGASEVIDRASLGQPSRPLEKARWAGAIDSAGGAILAGLLARMQYGGVVAACGLAAGAVLATTVMPFILRAVSLVGINSVETPMPLRLRAWERLADEMPIGRLDQVASVRPLADVPMLAHEILAGKLRGRTVIEVG